MAEEESPLQRNSVDEDIDEEDVDNEDIDDEDVEDKDRDDEDIDDEDEDEVLHELADATDSSVQVEKADGVDSEISDVDERGYCDFSSEENIEMKLELACVESKKMKQLYKNRLKVTSQQTY